MLPNPHLFHVQVAAYCSPPLELHPGRPSAWTWRNGTSAAVSRTHATSAAWPLGFQVSGRSTSSSVGRPQDRVMESDVAHSSEAMVQTPGVSDVHRMNLPLAHRHFWGGPSSHSLSRFHPKKRKKKTRVPNKQEGMGGPEDPLT